VTTFAFNEEQLSQIPALQLLINLGYKYVSPARALALRGGRRNNVILDEVLREQLKLINRITYKGGEHLFSEENVQSAIQQVKSVRYDGLQRTNENVFDLLTLGTTLPQTIEGDSKSFNLRYIDWDRPANNAFHVAAEFAVERTKSDETTRPDVVLFVNGIPLAVIECKAPATGADQAISQHLRNQSPEYIPRLFTFAQILLAVSKNEAKYATIGSKPHLWATWRERDDDPAAVASVVNTPLTEARKAELFSGEFAVARRHFDALEAAGEREVTAQNAAIYSLCRPERLLDLAYRFTLFENGEKRIARYQQYFVVKSTLERVKTFDENGARAGGMVWHTQGSGKSLTMVMLARSLALDPEISSPRIVLVCDRDDLDKQLKNTFAACGLSPQRATSGRNLLKLVSGDTAIVTTLIHKFESALEARSYVNDSPDVFMLVDESHRTNFGALSARMRQMFPRACYLGFTGTPLMKKERNNFLRFGELIDPSYPMRQAVEDGAVVPLLYEGRHVVMEQDQAAIDLWFERYTRGLTSEQQADLKKKYARAEMLSKADRVVFMRAFDISEHFRASWQGTGFKAQLVAPSKLAALKYKECLDEIGDVTSEVLISGPDLREGYDDIDGGPADEVVKFWKRMMARYGDEAEYNKQLISRFKNDPSEPEIIIVVDKLLTGFDAHRNTVLYLCRKLSEPHTLLQAVARVNRLSEGKEFGYIIDYEGTLGDLDRALTTYETLADFREEDLADTVRSVNVEIAKLPQRCSDVWDLFKVIANKHDEEAYELLLADKALRDEFYERLSAYARTLGLALSTEAFVRETDDAKIRRYKADLRRFENLRRSVRFRYAEAVSYGEYEPRIKKLLDTHIGADEVIRLNEPVNIFDDEQFAELKAASGMDDGESVGAKADAIAHATKHVISERMDEDPALFAAFSEMIQKAIDDFLARRLSGAEYLEAVVGVRDRVIAGQHDGAPPKLRGNDAALAYFGVIAPVVQAAGLDDEVGEDVACDAALAVPDILRARDKVQFWDDTDAQNLARTDIEDYFCDKVRDDCGAALSYGDIDEVIEKVMRVARSRASR
jgi:type I restriction enzyme R subunit